MFQKKVVLLEQVYEDLENGKNFYNSIEQGVGNYFVNCLLTDLESLQFYPGVHKKVFGYYQALSKRFPYGIYYENAEETIIVVAILDMRQNPKKIQKRIRK